LLEKSISIIPTVERQYGANAGRYCKIGFCKPLSDIEEALGRIEDLLNKL
jgi:hypothetical protein